MGSFKRFGKVLGELWWLKSANVMEGRVARRRFLLFEINLHLSIGGFEAPECFLSVPEEHNEPHDNAPGRPKNRLLR